MIVAWVEHLTVGHCFFYAGYGGGVIKMRMKEVDWLAYVLVTVGALNWGLVGAFRLDLVQTVLGTSPALVQLVYILVGLAGLYSLYKMTTKGKK